MFPTARTPIGLAVVALALWHPTDAAGAEPATFHGTAEVVASRVATDPATIGRREVVIDRAPDSDEWNVARRPFRVTPTSAALLQLSAITFGGHSVGMCAPPSSAVAATDRQVPAARSSSPRALRLAAS